MKMKKLITLLLALAMVLSLAACGSKDTPAPDGQNTPAATYKIKLGTTGNEEHQSTIAANFFKEKVEELTNGAVTVEIYPNSQLGSEREMAEGVKLGTLEMTIVTTDGTLPAWVPETQVLSIPYLLTSKEVAYEVLDNTLQPYFAPLFEAQVLLCKQAAKNFHTICKKETALKRVLSNLLSAVSLLRFKAVFSCGFRVPPGSGLYQSCAAGSVCIPAGQKYCSPRPRKSCPADRKTPGLPSRCIGHRW